MKLNPYEIKESMSVRVLTKDADGPPIDAGGVVSGTDKTSEDLYQRIAISCV
jgi:hypothetical protein